MSVGLPDSPALGAISTHTSPPAFEPYIPAATVMRELTVLPLVVGAVLGMIFGASAETSWCLRARSSRDGPRSRYHPDHP